MDDNIIIVPTPTTSVKHSSDHNLDSCNEFGALKSPYDPEDFIFECLAQGDDGEYIYNPPSELDLRKYAFPSGDQGQRGTCAAFAGAGIFEIQKNIERPDHLEIKIETNDRSVSGDKSEKSKSPHIVKRSNRRSSERTERSERTAKSMLSGESSTDEVQSSPGVLKASASDSAITVKKQRKQTIKMNRLNITTEQTDPRVSPEFIYYHRGNKPSHGMYGRDVFTILKNVGVVPEVMYPYGTTEPPNEVLYQISQHNRIANFAKIASVDGLKRALSEIGPCYIVLPLYKSRPVFWHGTPSEKSNGGHALIVCGYTTAGFLLKNSWGPTWNGDGCIIFPYEDWSYHWEVWVPINKPVTTRGYPTNFDLNNKEKRSSCIIC